MSLRMWIALALIAFALAAGAHYWVHGLARHLAAQALGVKGTGLPLAIADREAYRASPPGRRLIAAAAGPVANYALVALTFLAGMIITGTPQTTTRVERVMPGEPADQAGVQPGDRILSLGGKPVATSEELVATIRARGQGSLAVEVERAGRRQHLAAEVKGGRIGIMLATERRPLSPEAAGRALVLPAQALLQAAGQFVGDSEPRNLQGPVGITRVLARTGDSSGPVMMLMVLAQLSSMAWPLSILLAFLTNRARG